MSRSDRVRRGTTLLALVLILLTVPAIASATFTGGTQATQQVTTARLVAPTQITGSYECTQLFGRASITVTVRDFVDQGPAGASYAYTLTTGKGDVLQQMRTPNRTTSVTGNQRVGWFEGTTWRLEIRSELRSWQGPPSTKSISCSLLGGSGQL